jgi:hypothetical protein
MRRRGTLTVALGAAWVATLAAAETPPQPPGIYVEQAAAAGEPGVEKLQSSPPTRTGVKDIAKTVVKGMLTGGMLGGGPKMAVFFSGARSPVRLSPQPMFQFHFDPKAAAAAAPAPNDMAAMMAMMGQSQSEMPPGISRPQDFALVRLQARNDEREMEASSDMKPNRKHTVACRVRQLGPYTFRVAPEQPLPPGEYGFVAVPRNPGGAMDRLWDFGVDAPSTAVP